MVTSCMLPNQLAIPPPPWLSVPSLLHSRCTYVHIYFLAFPIPPLACTFSTYATWFSKFYCAHRTSWRSFTSPSPPPPKKKTKTKKNKWLKNRPAVWVRTWFTNPPLFSNVTLCRKKMPRFKGWSNHKYPSPLSSWFNERREGGGKKTNKKKSRRIFPFFFFFHRSFFPFPSPLSSLSQKKRVGLYVNCKKNLYSV